MTLPSLQCRGATSPTVWSSLGPTVRSAPLVVSVVAVARQQAVEASRQVAVRQEATVPPRRAVEEVARLVVLAPGKGK
jgi:hypothetical protein